MIRQAGVSSRLRLVPRHLIALGVIAAFTLALLGLRFVGLPVWFLFLPILAAGYAFVVIQRPFVGLLFVISVFFLPIRLGGVTLLQTVGVLTAILIIAWFLIQRQPIVFGNFIVPLFCLGLLALSSYFFTRDVGRTHLVMRLWLFNMVFALLMINLVTRFDLFRRVVWAILLMAVINAVAGIIEYAGTSEAEFRSEGLLENANQFGNLAALAFPLALFQYLYRKGPLRWCALALSAICVGGVIASVSRGAFIALITVFGVILVVERRRILALVLVAALAVAAIPLVPEYFIDRVDNLAQDLKGTVVLDDKTDLTTRGYLNKGGLRIWAAHPLLGVGIGNFGLYFVQREFNPGMKSSTAVPAHNIYLQALVESGVVGFAVLIWLILITLRNVIRARRLSVHDTERWLYFGGIEMMALAVMIGSFSTGSLMGKEFWLMVCLPGVSGRVAQAEFERARSAVPSRDGPEG